MTFEDLLNEYLDGTLSDSSEQTLFSAIASNDEYRRDFSDALRVRTAVRQEAVTIDVPQSLSHSIFESLGYGAAQTATPIAVVPWWKIFTNGMKHTVPYLLTSAAGAGIMWLLLWNTNITQNSVNRNAYNGVTKPATTENLSYHKAEEKQDYINAETPIKSAPVITRYYRVESNSIGRKTDNSDMFIQSVEKESSDEIDISPKENNIDKSSYKETHFSIMKRDENSIIKYNLPELYTAHTKKADDNSEQFPVEFSIRSLQLSPQHKANVPDNNAIGINNISLALFYRFNSDMSLGLEAGRESFVQLYTRENDIAIENINQYPTLWWGGLAGKYEARSLIGNSFPFPTVTSSVGLAETGAYIRASAGLGWDIVPSVTMNIGAEWAELFYNAQSQSYTSSNFGWMYGFTIRF